VTRSFATIFVDWLSWDSKLPNTGIPSDDFRDKLRTRLRARLVPSQGTAPVSPLFSAGAVPYCYGAGQQDSSGYSFAKEGTMLSSTITMQTTLSGPLGPAHPHPVCVPAFA